MVKLDSDSDLEPEMFQTYGKDQGCLKVHLMEFT
jgi:hypothetical protein